MADKSRLGAARQAKLKTRIVMRAWTGQRFSLVGPQEIDFEKNATSWSEA
jgi:hypothetical protein